MSGHEQDVIEVHFVDLVCSTVAAAPRGEALLQGLNVARCAHCERMISVHCQKHVAFFLIVLGKSGVRVTVHLLSQHFSVYLLSQHFLKCNVLKVVLLHENLEHRE